MLTDLGQAVPALPIADPGPSRPRRAAPGCRTAGRSIRCAGEPPLRTLETCRARVGRARLLAPAVSRSAFLVRSSCRMETTAATVDTIAMPIASVAASAVRAATTGLRRHQRQARVPVPSCAWRGLSGRPGIAPGLRPCLAPRRTSRTSRAPSPSRRLFPGRSGSSGQSIVVAAGRVGDPVDQLESVGLVECRAEREHLIQGRSSA